MTKLIRIGLGALGLGAMSITFGSGVALADDYAGQSYSDASSAISGAGNKAVIATSVGDGVSQGDCVVTRSQKAAWLKGDNFSPVTDTVLLYLNCDAKLAKAGKAGNSLASPEGRPRRPPRTSRPRRMPLPSRPRPSRTSRASSLTPGGD